jgi:predicted HTH transcriptional regulator
MARARAKPEEAARESTRVEFKEQLDPADGGDWCEVIKDIVAIANSGGGSIVLGIKNDGTPSGWIPPNFSPSIMRRSWTRSLAIQVSNSVNSRSANPTALENESL